MNIDNTINDFIELCHYIHGKGYVSGSGGNISIRVGDKFIITPSGKSLGHIKKEDIIFLNSDRTFIGTGIPSKECAMHLSCYNARPDVNAIIHVHSIYSVAVSCLDSLSYNCAMPVYTPGYAIRVNELPVIPYFKPGSEELAKEVTQIITSRNSVMMANHGILAVGTSIEQAINIIEEIEENAQLYFLLCDKGHPITPQQIKEVCPKP